MTHRERARKQIQWAEDQLEQLHHTYKPPYVDGITAVQVMRSASYLRGYIDAYRELEGMHKEDYSDE